MQNNQANYTENLDEILISSPDLTVIMSSILAKGNQVRLRAKGWSMGPFIRNHDIVTIAPLTQKRIKLGEIVAFKNQSGDKNVRVSLHRVLQFMDYENYLIKGDNTGNYPDGIVSRRRILGRVIKIERNNRSVRMGMGVERRLIAWLSKHNILISFINSIREINTIFSKRKSR